MDNVGWLFHDVVAGGFMRSLFVSVLPFALVAVVACTKNASSDATKDPSATTTATTPGATTTGDQAKTAEPPPVPPRVDGPVGIVLDSYDTLRLQLAHDDAAGAVKSAAKIADAAKSASDASTSATKKPLADLAAHADKMAKSDDLVGARAAFGDVSKDLVAVLVADPSLQTGRFLFLCPMAKGYQKWVQTTTKLENPFFGKAMIDCGEQLKSWAV